MSSVEHNTEGQKPTADDRFAALEKQVKGLSEKIDILLARFPVNRVTEVASDQDTYTMSRFLQTWHSFSPQQKARLWPTLENTAPPVEAADGQEYLDALNAGIALGRSPDRVRQLIKEGRLEGVCDPRGRYYVSRSAIDNFHPNPPGRPSKTLKS